VPRGQQGGESKRPTVVGKRYPKVMSRVWERETGGQRGRSANVCKRGEVVWAG